MLRVIKLWLLAVYTVKNEVFVYSHLKVFSGHPSITSHLKVYNNTYEVLLRAGTEQEETVKYFRGCKLS